VRRILSESGFQVWSLTRPTQATGVGLDPNVILGSLESLPELERIIPVGATFLHLAAQTGRAHASAFQLVNVEGTRSLLEAAKRAKAARFVFVSSIAAGYQDRGNYPYAESKRVAEELVNRAGLPFDIVRPTIILGPGSPALASLSRLAGAPIGIRLGSGNVQIQPIHLEDAAGALVELLSRPPTHDTRDLGGPEVLTLAAFLSMLRDHLRGTPGPFVSLPLGPIRGALRLLEPMVLTHLPFSAGQLAVFTQHSVVVNPPPPGSRLESFRPVEQMIVESPDG
jgi:nucleoside-diphosphate-sugar epimerase